jgi:biopolymer transport protein ExbB
MQRERANAKSGARCRQSRLLAVVRYGTGLAVLACLAPMPAIAQEASPPVVGTAALPRDLTPWGMFLNADIVVKAVLIGLLIASVITWTVWLAKTIELIGVKRRLRKALGALASTKSTTESAERISDTSVVGKFLDGAVAEWQASAGTISNDGLKERIASRLERIEAASARRIARGTGVLATIGATAPFVGLFGTVWGIMNSFIGISKAHTTNLAVVAPGIAEALLATAFGLAAAIPAVVIYNMFSRSIAGYRVQMGDASAEVMRLVSRDLDHRSAMSAQPTTKPSTAPSQGAPPSGVAWPAVPEAASRR